ncbi:MAG: hypothetical protein WDZ40_02420 [Candidatus Spechtbacterales bacterium]
MRILFGIDDPNRYLYGVVFVLVVFLVYPKLLQRVWFYEKEMNKLYRELWTKIKSESADTGVLLQVTKDLRVILYDCIM